MVAAGMEVAGARTANKTRWAVDPAHSVVEFALKHMMFSTVKGRFKEFSGVIEVDEGDLRGSAVRVTVGAASIDTHDAKRDADLRSSAFFDVERFPTLTFVSTRVEPVTADRHRLIGDLTIHGVTREVVLDTTFNGEGVNPWGQAVRGYTAETAINRRDFGLTTNVPLEAGGVLIGDNVKITLEVEATKEG